MQSGECAGTGKKEKEQGALVGSDFFHDLMASPARLVRKVGGIASDWSSLLLPLWFNWAGEGVRAGTSKERGSQHHGAEPVLPSARSRGGWSLDFT